MAPTAHVKAGYESSPLEWRATFQGALLTETEPAALHQDLVAGITGRAWSSLEDARGRRFRTFDEFCRTDLPLGLGSDPHKVRAFLERLVGQRRAKLILVSASAQGARDLPKVGRRSTRRDDRVRAIAERAPAPIVELYCNDLLGAKEAERFGRRRYPADAEKGAQRFLRRAERLLHRGLPIPAARDALRRELNSEVRSIFGTTQPQITCSAVVGTNADLLPQILALYVKPKSRVVDVTYGRGVFWRDVPAGTYDLLGSDLIDGVDCRELPYEDTSVDCVVLDPPYKRNGDGLGAADFGAYYRNHERGTSGHGSVLALYRAAAKEALRVLKRRGILITKCQDEYASGKQRWTHIELMGEFEKMGFRSEDLFVLVQHQTPMVNLNFKTQRHARKNHSFALVHRKR